MGWGVLGCEWRRPGSISEAGQPGVVRKQLVGSSG